MKINLIIFLLLVANVVFAQRREQQGEFQRPRMSNSMTEEWDPEVPYIEPGKNPGDPPADAIILFNETTGLSEWTTRSGKKPGWLVEDGILTVVKDSGNIETKRKFGSCQMHIEWRTPVVVSDTGQMRGNSGIFFPGGYEVQILDSYINRTYKNGQAGSLYKQRPPLVNVSKKPMEWQTYDLIYTAPIFAKDGTYLHPPRVTLFHNGVVVQNNVAFRGPTVVRGVPEYFVKPHETVGSIMLQDHLVPVSFKNIWIREL